MTEYTENPGDLAASPRAAGLDRLLREEPYRFSFFQAVRILERLNPQCAPVGSEGPPADEFVRFRAHASLAFPASEIHDFTPPRADGQPAEMIVAFMGLTGPSGALPRGYTELILERARLKDRTLRDFLDLFNHRLISLFHRAWEKNRFWLAYERAEIELRREIAAGPRQVRSYVLQGRSRRDVLSQSMLDLGGLGFPALRYRATTRDSLSRRTDIDDEALRFYAGLLAQQHRSAAGLRGLLEDYFGAPVEILQFSGQWLALEPEDQSRFAFRSEARLGVNLVVGERFWDMQGKFRIRLGPLTYAQFRDFLPSGTAFRALGHLARLYAGRQFDIDVQLSLKAAEAPGFQLTAGDGARLGWNTWVFCEQFSHDVDDAVLEIPDNSERLNRGHQS
jgi:type VI secretion system protein ImpH